MGDPLPGLDIASPVLAAPMAGGATTPGLVIAAARAGSLGFLAGGYKTPRQLAADIRAVRQHTPAFGVNLFVPRRHPPIEPDAFRAYADALAGDARQFGIDLSTARPVEDDDGWAGKIDVVTAERVPVVLDGVIAGSAALVAVALAPDAREFCVAGHRSAEPGHAVALRHLALRPLVDLDLRLGEGTGALLALPLVQSAVRVLHEVATFDSAGVAHKDGSAGAANGDASAGAESGDGAAGAAPEAGGPGTG